MFNDYKDIFQQHKTIQKTKFKGERREEFHNVDNTAASQKFTRHKASTFQVDVGAKQCAVKLQDTGNF